MFVAGSWFLHRDSSDVSIIFLSDVRIGHIGAIVFVKKSFPSTFALLHLINKAASSNLMMIPGHPSRCAAISAAAAAFHFQPGFYLFLAYKQLETHLWMLLHWRKLLFWPFVASEWATIMYHFRLLVPVSTVIHAVLYVWIFWSAWSAWLWKCLCTEKKNHLNMAVWINHQKVPGTSH